MNPAPLPASPRSWRTRNLGLFSVEERHFGDVVLEDGLRLERQRIAPAAAAALDDYADDAFGASPGAPWKFSDAAGFALNLTSTGRQPTATELRADGPHLAVQRFELGDPAIGTERARTFDLALRGHFGEWRTSVALFLSDYTEFIHARRTGAPRPGAAVCSGSFAAVTCSTRTPAGTPRR